MLLSKERYGDSLSGQGSNTQPSDWKAGKPCHKTDVSSVVTKVWQLPFADSTMLVLFFFGQNVWKYRLINTAAASFNTTKWQMTEMSQRKKQLGTKPSPCIYLLTGWRTKVWLLGRQAAIVQLRPVRRFGSAGANHRSERGRRRRVRILSWYLPSSQPATTWAKLYHCKLTQGCLC